jgi:hypothetical protein
MIPPLFGKQEVGIWRVKKHFPRYVVPIWSLWPNIRSLLGFYTHWTYMHIFLSNYWWQRSDIWSQASYRYHISWEVFFDPSDSWINTKWRMYVEDITNIIWASTFREDFESSTMAAILWPNPYEEFLWTTSHILFIPTKWTVS